MGSSDHDAAGREAHSRPGDSPLVRANAGAGPYDVESLEHALLFAATPVALLVLTPDLVIRTASDAYLRATSTRLADIVGKSIFEVFPDNPDERDATGVNNLRASLERVVATGRPDPMAVQRYDIREPRAGESAATAGFVEHYWSPINVPVHDASGRLRYILHKVDDVTDYVRLANSQRDEVAANQVLSDRTAAMEAEVMLRGQELQLVNRELRAVHEQLERRVAERTAELERSRAALLAEVEQRRKATSDLARLETQLQSAQRLDAIGKLAGGIAHDFNNILTVILGCASLLRGQIAEDDPAVFEIDQIRSAGERAANLTHQLLTFSRQDAREAASLDLGELVLGMRPMLSRLIGEHIELIVERALDLAPIEANRSEMEQVVLNLAVNARDAMPNGGRLAIATSNVTLDAAAAGDLVEALPGAYVQLSVSDTGCGMDQATQSRIFEPFFTTKPFGKGTGLGLATLFGIVRSSHGHVRVRSEPGKGTVIEVLMPQHTAAAAELPAMPVPRTEPPRARAGECLLLVEDDDQVRDVARRMLEAAGYHVIEAKGPEEALAIARTPSARIDALVTDVVMPRMGGRQLAEIVTAIRPGIAVLFLSGYSDDMILQRGVRASVFALVRKPLVAAVLGAKVRAVLDRQPADAVGEPSIWKSPG